MSRTLDLPSPEGARVSCVFYEASGAPSPLLVLAHGAGAGQHSHFMTAFADAVAALGVSVLTFDFPYMQQRRRVPDRAPVLEAAWVAALEGAREEGLVAERGCIIGGKSMGGRIASQVAATHGASLGFVRGLVLLGYPLHPPGRPERPRTAHLPGVRIPTLIVQGERDAFGTPDEVRQAFSAAAAPVDLLAIEGGDHSFKVSRGLRPQTEVNAQIHRAVVQWIRAHAQ